jgi:hypothetical protein
LEPAFEYGLYGLQTQAILFSLWPLMGQAYEKLAHLTANWPGNPSLALERLTAKLHTSLEALRAVNGDMSAWLASREAVYADMYAECARGLRDKSSNPSLATCLIPSTARQDIEALEKLRTALGACLLPTHAVEHAAVARLVSIVMSYCKQEQAVVRSLCQSQHHINQLLERASPTRALLGWDLQGYYRLQARRGWQAYLLEDIAESLRIRIEVGADHIDVAALAADA